MEDFTEGMENPQIHDPKSKQSGINVRWPSFIITFQGPLLQFVFQVWFNGLIMYNIPNGLIELTVFLLFCRKAM